MRTRKFPTFIKVPCPCTEEENYRHGRPKNCFRCRNTREMTTTEEAEERFQKEQKEHEEHQFYLKTSQWDYLYK